MPIGYREFAAGLRKLGIGRSSPVIFHASMSAFGQVHGGADSILGALMANYNSLMAPTFTYRTMLVPEGGPPDNGMTYGSGKDKNLMAEFFHSDMPADRLIGAVPEALRRHPDARRSIHPILSFAGIHVVEALQAQTIAEPLAPIRVITGAGGWVLLLGVDHTVNTSIHYAEKLAGRKQFVRWALTRNGVQECPGFPGCSEGFQAIAPRLRWATRRALIGSGQVEAVSLADLVNTVQKMISENPLALLCNRSYCERCLSVREVLSSQPAPKIGNLP